MARIRKEWNIAARQLHKSSQRHFSSSRFFRRNFSKILSKIAHLLQHSSKKTTRLSVPEIFHLKFQRHCSPTTNNCHKIFGLKGNSFSSKLQHFETRFCPSLRGSWIQLTKLFEQSQKLLEISVRVSTRARRFGPHTPLGGGGSPAKSRTNKNTNTRSVTK